MVKTKAQAQHDARALRKRLHGRNWKTSVWQLVDWHYEVKTPRVSVRPTYGGKLFEAHLNHPISIRQFDKDPNEAVVRALCAGQHFINKCQEFLHLAAQDTRGGKS